MIAKATPWTSALADEVRRLRELDQRCHNSVVECMARFPNIHEYVAQLEKERDALQKRVQALQPMPFQNPRPAEGHFMGDLRRLD